MAATTMTSMSTGGTQQLPTGYTSYQDISLGSGLSATLVHNYAQHREHAFTANQLMVLLHKTSPAATILSTPGYQHAGAYVATKTGSLIVVTNPNTTCNSVWKGRVYVQAVHTVIR